ncbi:polygalacturonase-like isoform X1 [Agrilus planipennis]|uniref:endo-polygalacturonase n=1 Tax=Agrilus planipennis TaxID=224129 RepID=A0A1W4X0G0_AGRPL|nr:polygalacturonase-like isoform X1 [Agrilus planipennis]
MKLYLKVLLGLAIVVATVFTQNNNCTLTGNSLDNLIAIQRQCTEIVIENFTVPANRTLLLRRLQNGTRIIFRGTIRFEYEEWDGDLIVVSGSNITVIGDPGHLFNCHGERWWDGFGGNGGKLKPKFFRTTNLNYSTVTGLRVKNTPKQVFSVNRCNHVVFSNIIIDNVDGDSRGGHNTDGFDLNENKDITIQNSQIVNQDDCFAIGSGTNCNFFHNHCSGGHGISIGSVGGRRNNVVRNVHVKNCSVVDSENGIRIKTIVNATGQVRDIKYEGITMRNITNFGILVRGDYLNGGPTGHPTAGVPITNLTLDNVRGWVRQYAVNVYVLLADGVASGWKWTNVSITGSTLNNFTCTGVPPNSGVKC